MTQVQVQVRVAVPVERKVRAASEREEAVGQVVLLYGGRGTQGTTKLLSLLREGGHDPARTLVLSESAEARMAYAQAGCAVTADAQYPEHHLQRVLEEHAASVAAEPSVILIDGMAASRQFRSLPVLRQIVANARHLRLSVYWAEEYQFDVPPWVRVNADRTLRAPFF